MTEKTPEWLNTPAEVIGLLLTGGGLALYAVVIVAQVWRDQPVTIWPLPLLAIVGAAIYTGHRLGRLRASRDGVEVDVGEGGDTP